MNILYDTIKNPKVTIRSSGIVEMMKIGELAKRSGFTVETIRYYEREGLLPEAVRNLQNNYRQYQQKHLERLLFIRRCRALEMSHEEIRQLLTAKSEADVSCASVCQLIDKQLETVQQRIDELQALASELKGIRKQCDATTVAKNCGILQALERVED